MSKWDSNLLLTDILESIHKIRLYTQGIELKEFLSDEKTQDAVIRNFGIIGEAASRIPEETKNNNSNVNWQRLRGFRNRIIHDYMGVDYRIVWTIVQNDLGVLEEDIKKILDA